MANNYDAWNKMFEANKEMMDAWMKLLPTGGAAPTNNNIFDYNKYQEWMETWQDNLQNMTKQAQWFQNPYGSWKNMMNMYNPLTAGKFMSGTTRDAFEKMLNSNKLYLGMYEQWEKFNKEILKPGTKEYKENLDALVNQFNNIFMNNFVPLLPKELQGLMTNSQSYFNTYINTLENFVGPWSYAYQDINEIFMESMFNDPMKLSDALKEWKKAYDETIGALIKSPVVGNSREILEQNNRAIDAMIDMIVSVSEFMAKSLGVAYKRSQEAFEEYFESLENGAEPKTFNEFYKEWSKRVEDAIETYFYTDEFSQLIAKTAETAMVFKIEYGKVIEKALSEFPIVTESEVDNVYKNVYELKREVRSLKKEMEEIKKLLEERK